ncbi:protein IRX15-LIKE-like [Zingiber officinale]|uniref:Polysaccharide biosynthesis domain-containing protein n=1 Tax=Zingiber officinale TaxID=94328 RepID=A0A8J5LGL0_ZINOF|nr:protein IRX15-LIKE-like [Zingiber officinale]KAG6516965.1 hypothetical protein ZIOFF_020341 [Zingiber officinale]
MKGISSTKLVFLQPSSLNKQQGGGGGNGAAAPSISILVSHHHRIWLIAFLSFLSLASLLTLFTTTAVAGPRVLRFSSSVSDEAPPAEAPPAEAPLPALVFDTLVNYAASSNSSGKMRETDLRAIAGVLRRRSPCNLLVFGLSHETPLWRALNAGGRTVFVDENEYYIAHVEGRNPGLEGYEVSYATKVGDLRELIAASRQMRRGECRPVQNLLFSDCRLAVNDLPNRLYDVAWDVVIVDGPKGYAARDPGRMAAIYTAAVMARSVGRRGGQVDVLVHDYNREVERICSAEFLCTENQLGGTTTLGHFVIRRGPADDFCTNRTTASSSSSPAGGSKAGQP